MICKVYKNVPPHVLPPEDTKGCAPPKLVANKVKNKESRKQISTDH